MEELLSLAQKISQLSTAVLLLLILIGGHRRWWAWGYQLVECEARCIDRVKIAEQREREWRELALSGAITARAAVETLKKQA